MNFWDVRHQNLLSILKTKTNVMLCKFEEDFDTG